MLNRLFRLRCPECKEEIEEDERYCPHCGADLDAPVEPVKLGQQETNEYLKSAQEWYDQGNNLDTALEYCDLVIQNDPVSAVAYNLRGLILDALGRSDDAIESYQEALRIDPSSEDAKTNLEDAQSELQKHASDSSRKKKIVLTLILSFLGVAVIACTVIGVVGFYKVFSPYIGPKATIILEPDYSPVSTVKPTELENAIQILRERSKSFGYESVSFDVSKNGQVICKIPVSVDIETFTKRVLAIGLLEFVDFGATPVPSGTMVATDFDFAFLKQPDGTRWHTVMTNAEIETASLSADSLGKPAVSFLLTPNGKDILLEYTTNNVGKFLGIVLDKVVISSPMVNQPITDGSGIIQGAFTQEEAENLSAYLKIEPLPIPLIVVEIKK